MESYIEKTISSLSDKIFNSDADDYAIVSKFRLYRGKYEYAVMYGENEHLIIGQLYVRKEAYRTAANKRGYPDELLLGDL